MHQPLTLTARRFTQFQCLAVAVMVLAALLNLLIAEALGVTSLRPLRVGAEDGVQTWFSVLNLTLASGLALVLAIATRGQPRWLMAFWGLLAALMLLLSLDEAVQIHEQLLEQGAALAPGLPQLHSHGWVILGALFVGGAGLLFLPFLWRLPRRLMVRLVVAGGVFVFGALGVESFGALADYYDWLAREDVAYKIRRIVEEGCEMLGIALFNRALYIECANAGLSLDLGADSGRAS